MKLAALCCVLACVVGAAVATDSTQWGFVTTNNNGNRARVVIGLNRRSMVLIPDEVKDHKRCSIRTINQHDFQQGYVAMKDPVKRSCWVKPLGERETYDETKRIMDSGIDMTQVNEKWLVPERSLDKDQVEREVGSLLSDFCSDSDVYMLKRDAQGLSAGRASCTSHCGYCMVEGIPETNPQN